MIIAMVLMHKLQDPDCSRHYILALTEINLIILALPCIYSLGHFGWDE